MFGRKSKVAPLNIDNLTDFRFLLAETQDTFWATFGVRQSTGSRYEKGLAVPLSVAILLMIRAEGLLTDKQLNYARTLAVGKVYLSGRKNTPRRSAERANHGPLKSSLEIKQVTVPPARDGRTGPRRRGDRM